MNWELRNRIFSMMMAFTRKADFRYRCVYVDKKFIASEEQMLQQLKDGISSFLDVLVSAHPHVDSVKVYYDCGQTPITNLLHETIGPRLGTACRFMQGVKPVNYKLFQVADLICTVSLIAQKLNNGLLLTNSEDKFFGGPRMFKRNILKYIKRKEI